MRRTSIFWWNILHVPMAAMTSEWILSFSVSLQCIPTLQTKLIGVSLNDLLMLAINGRLSGTYSGPVQSPEEYGAPASLRFPFKEDRLNRAGDPSAKRGRKGFAKMGAMAKSKSNTSFEYKVLTAGTSEFP